MRKSEGNDRQQTGGQPAQREGDRRLLGREDVCLPWLFDLQLLMVLE